MILIEMIEIKVDQNYEDCEKVGKNPPSLCSHNSCPYSWHSPCSLILSLLSVLKPPCEPPWMPLKPL